MQLDYRKTIAREFLILLSTGVLSGLFYLGLIIYNKYNDSQLRNLEKQLQSNKIALTQNFEDISTLNIKRRRTETDKLKAFYDILKTNPSVKGIPDNYLDFENALQDPTTAKEFHKALLQNPSVEGVPIDFDLFSDKLGLKKAPNPYQKQAWEALRAKYNGIPDNFNDFVKDITNDPIKAKQAHDLLSAKYTGIPDETTFYSQIGLQGRAIGQLADNLDTLTASSTHLDSNHYAAAKKLQRENLELEKRSARFVSLHLQDENIQHSMTVFILLLLLMCYPFRFIINGTLWAIKTLKVKE